MEIGCGTGCNLPLLCEAVGGEGQVIGVDASPGMLARAQVIAHDAPSVRLLRQDAAELMLASELDTVVFSLSYSVLPERERVLDRAREALRPGDRLVIMDCGLVRTPLAGVLAPIVDVIATLSRGTRIRGRGRTSRGSRSQCRPTGSSSACISFAAFVSRR